MAITFIASIPAVLLYHPVLHDHNYILGAGHDTRIELGAVLEFFLMIANIGVAVVMYPILKRESERVALGYVASRGSLVVTGRALVAIHNWTFLAGPGLCVGVNDVLLGYLMYSTALMPPRLALFGLIGGPLIFASKIAIVFGAWSITSSTAGIFAIPVIVFEASFAIYLIVKGFRPSRVLTGQPAT